MTKVVIFTFWRQWEREREREREREIGTHGSHHNQSYIQQPEK